MVRSAVVSLVAVTLALAGCVGAEKPAASTTAPLTTAPEPVVDEDFGSISGVVVDEENVPVAGAAVLLLETQNQTKADTAGQFTFNGLDAGSYSIIASRLGYTDATKRVTVAPGEVAEVTLTLGALEIAEEPYTLTVPKVGYIVFGNAWTQFGTQVANQTGAHAATCEGCTSVIHFDHKPMGLLLEAEWQCGCTPPAVNMDVWIKYLKDWTTGDTLDGTVVLNTYLSNREQFYLGETGLESAQKAKEDKLLFLLHAGNYINMQNRVNSYHSFLYNAEEFPDGFTALPPPA